MHPSPEIKMTAPEQGFEKTEVYSFLSQLPDKIPGKVLGCIAIGQDKHCYISFSSTDQLFSNGRTGFVVDPDIDPDENRVPGLGNQFFQEPEIGISSPDQLNFVVN